jgi:hypothetical protein
MFARKLWYGAHDGDCSHTFAALLELRRRKNRMAESFVIVQHIDFIALHPRGDYSLNREIRFPGGILAQEAIARFSPDGKEFPGWESDRWKKTTGWFYAAAVGGSYELHSSGSWVNVGSPNPYRARRHKREKVVVDCAARLLRLCKDELRFFERQLSDAHFEINVHQRNIDEYGPEDVSELELLAEAQRDEQASEAAVSQLRPMVLNLVDELRFRKALALNMPYWPRNERGIIVRPISLPT